MRKSKKEVKAIARATAKAVVRELREERKEERRRKEQEKFFFLPTERKITIDGEVDFHLVPDPSMEGVIKFSDFESAKEMAQMMERISGRRMDVLRLSEKSVQEAERELNALVPRLFDSLNRIEEERKRLMEMGVSIPPLPVDRMNPTMGKAIRLGKDQMVLPSEYLDFGEKAFNMGCCDSEDDEEDEEYDSEYDSEK